MSFHTADAIIARNNVDLAALIPGNVDDEQRARDILAEALPSSLGRTYGKLGDFVPTALADLPVFDGCLHCHGFTRTEMLTVRRIAMFDVPRQLFAAEHGAYVYWLYGNVFILSRTAEIDLDWAAKRHACRLQWRLTGKEPSNVMPAEKAWAYVRSHLHDKAALGLQRLKDDLRQEQVSGEPMRGIPVKGPLFEPATAWFGSVTGGELLRRELGLDQRLTAYNCCKASTDHVPSAVRQLQAQDPASRDC